MATTPLSRRDWLKLSSASVVGYSMSGWLERIAGAAASDPKRKRACILLWMNGGPSQIDTFDLKPGHANGGPIREIATSVPGIRISEHLPKIARHMDQMAIIRSMTSKEADHGRASYLYRTGLLPMGSLDYPTIGSLISKELGDENAALPNFVSIAPYRFFNSAAYGPGFLGPKYSPLIVGENNYNFGVGGRNDTDVGKALKVQDLTPAKGMKNKQIDARLDLLQSLEKDFLKKHPGVSPQSHAAAYDRAVRLMKTEASKAFNVEEESDQIRDAYGRNIFGQGCLLARRLVERGVPFVEVTLSQAPGINNNAFGWDTHTDNFNNVRKLCDVLDPAWATLMTDLKDRGLLDTTTIIWMGEFGRTPKISNGNGRDHFPNVASAVLAGGGIKGGQVVGRTSADGTTIEDRETPIPDLLATLVQAMGIDPMKQNKTPDGRPIHLVEKTAQPISEIIKS